MVKLDLHGVRHYEVDRMVENFIFANQKHFPIEIICGNSSRMISLVMNVLNRVGCETCKDLSYGTIIIRKFK